MSQIEDVNFSQLKKNLEKELYVHFLLIGSKTPQTYEYNWICLFLSTFVLILMWNDVKTMLFTNDYANTTQFVQA